MLALKDVFMAYFFGYLPYSVSAAKPSNSKKDTSALCLTSVQSLVVLELGALLIFSTKERCFSALLC